MDTCASRLASALIFLGMPRSFSVLNSMLLVPDGVTLICSQAISVLSTRHKRFYHAMLHCRTACMPCTCLSDITRACKKPAGYCKNSSALSQCDVGHQMLLMKTCYQSLHAVGTLQLPVLCTTDKAMHTAQPCSRDRPSAGVRTNNSDFADLSRCSAFSRICNCHQPLEQLQQHVCWVAASSLLGESLGT